MDIFGYAMVGGYSLYVLNKPSDRLPTCPKMSTRSANNLANTYYTTYVISLEALSSLNIQLFIERTINRRVCQLIKLARYVIVADFFEILGEPLDSVMNWP